MTGNISVQLLPWFKKKDLEICAFSHILSPKLNWIFSYSLTFFTSVCVCASHSVFSNSLRRYGGSPASSVEFARQDTGVGCHSLLQGIFLTQGSNLGLPHCRQILYHLRHQGIPSHIFISRTKAPTLFLKSDLIPDLPLHLNDAAILPGLRESHLWLFAFLTVQLHSSMLTSVMYVDLSPPCYCLYLTEFQALILLCRTAATFFTILSTHHLPPSHSSYFLDLKGRMLLQRWAEGQVCTLSTWEQLLLS